MFCVGAVLALNGCSEDYLEVAPKDAVFESSVWNSYQNTNLFLSGIYNRLDSGFLFSYDPFENWSDNSCATFGWVASNGSVARRDYSSSNSPVGGNWGSFYSSIRKCNIVLKKVPDTEGMTVEEKNLILGQTLFLRAHFYFQLSKYFGGVPLIDVPLDRNSGDNIFYGRSTYDETVDFIRKDLTDAVALLPKTWGSNDAGRATKGAALAMRNETELYAERWSDCVSTYNEIVALNKYDIVADYKSIFQPATEDNVEVMFDIEFDGDARSHTAEIFLSPRIDASGVAAGWGHMLPTQELIDAYEFKDGALGDDAAHANDPYTDRDNRFYASILYDGSTWRGATISTRWNPNVQQGTFSNSFDENHSHQGTLTGYYFSKYIDENLQPTETSYYGQAINKTNAIYYRFAEMLLNYAEAKNELSGPDQSVYDAINRLRARGGIPNLVSGLSKDDMRIKIRNERRVELAFEGKRYWDIMRWKIGDEVFNKSKGAMRIEENNGVLTYNRVDAFRGQMNFTSPRDYLFPIPQSAIDSNPELAGAQNPGF